MSIKVESEHPHQLISEPKAHDGYMDVMVAYVNHLEQQVYLYKLEWSASMERLHHQDHMPESDQLAAIRAKNTDLETEKIALKYDLALYNTQNIALRKQLIELERLYAKPNDTHPWDVKCAPSEGNPLGASANDKINILRNEVSRLADENVGLRKERDELREALNVERYRNAYDHIVAMPPSPDHYPNMTPTVTPSPKRTREQIEAASRENLKNYQDKTRDGERGE